MNEANKSKSNLIQQYSDTGVDIHSVSNFINFIKLTNHTANKGTMDEIGDFAGLFNINKYNYKEPILTASCDGVGSKLKIAIEANLYKYIGIDLVAMCINDIITKGAKPLFFLNYFAVNKLAPDRDTEIIKSIIDGCKIARCSLMGGETAQMSDLYKNKEFDLAGFAVGIVEKEKILPEKNLKNGDAIIGLHSSGLHANGFSLVRKIIEENNINIQNLAPWNTDMSIAEILLSPTIIYSSIIQKALNKLTGIKAISNITGGGITGNLSRILPDDLSANIELNKFPISGLFRWLKNQLRAEDEDMPTIFNCGIGMAIITDRQYAEEICNFFNQSQQPASIIGKLTNKATSPVIYKGILP